MRDSTRTIFCLLLALCLAGPLATTGLMAQQEAERLLLEQLRYPLAERLDHIPLFAPDDLPEDDPFLFRVGARLAKTVLEDVNAHELGTAVYALLPAGRLERQGASIVQTKLLFDRELRITITGLDPATTLDPESSIGRLSNARPMPRCTTRLQELGYPPGPHLAIRIEGLYDDDPVGRQEFRRFVTERLLPTLRRAPSAEPAVRAPRAPHPRERNLRGYVRHHEEQNGESSSSTIWKLGSTQDLRDLGFFRLEDGERIQIPQEGEVFEQLLQQFITGLRWPFPNVPGCERFFGEDDDYARLDHYSHLAFDFGARLRDRQGNFLVWPNAAPVYPLHRDLKDVRGTVEVVQDEYQLRLAIGAAHVNRTPGLAPQIGMLDAFDSDNRLGGWRTSDPYLRAIGAPKGNHLHVTVRGLYPGDPTERARRMWHQIRPAWLSAPGPDVVAKVRPVAPPAPGDGFEDEAFDPVGAAVMRAQRRLMKRRMQAIAADRTSPQPILVATPTLHQEQGPWTLILELPAHSRIRPPLRDTPVAAIEGGLQQHWIAHTGASSRALTVSVHRVARAQDDPQAWVTPSGMIEIDFELALPNAPAWILAYVLPVLLGEEV